jgi:hypothetical protein
VSSGDRVIWWSTTLAVLAVAAVATVVVSYERASDPVWAHAETGCLHEGQNPQGSGIRSQICGGVLRVALTLQSHECFIEQRGSLASAKRAQAIQGVLYERSKVAGGVYVACHGVPVIDDGQDVYEPGTHGAVANAARAMYRGPVKSSIGRPHSAHWSTLHWRMSPLGAFCAYWRISHKPFSSQGPG